MAMEHRALKTAPMIAGEEAVSADSLPDTTQETGPVQLLVIGFDERRLAHEISDGTAGNDRVLQVRRGDVLHISIIDMSAWRVL